MSTQVLTRWNYQVIEVADASKLQETLDSSGAAGWELVNATFESNGTPAGTYKTNRARNNGVYRLFFKQPV